MRAKERLILPLDVDGLAEAERLIALLQGEVGLFKVGLELFTACGPHAVRCAGADRTFLDLKLHDIPVTMARAAAAAARLGVRLLTVHASAGPDALRAVRSAVAGSETRVLGVTVLTSLNEVALHRVGLNGSTSAAARRLGRLALDCGLDGLVCSAHECEALRADLGAGPLLVVPGVRPVGAAQDDQQRRATPAEAIRKGASMLVVGRPIRQTHDPAAAARSIVDEIEKAQDE